MVRGTRWIAILGTERGRMDRLGIPRHLGRSWPDYLLGYCSCCLRHPYRVMPRGLYTFSARITIGAQAFVRDNRLDRCTLSCSTSKLAERPDLH